MKSKSEIKRRIEQYKSIFLKIVQMNFKKEQYVRVLILLNG